jgi:hypothetical protein
MKIDYNIVKCHPNLLEEKLNENGLLGWEFITLVIEQSKSEKLITDSNSVRIITNYCLIFKRVCQD